MSITNVSKYIREDVESAVELGQNPDLDKMTHVDVPAEAVRRVEDEVGLRNDVLDKAADLVIELAQGGVSVPPEIRALYGLSQSEVSDASGEDSDR